MLDIGLVEKFGGSETEELSLKGVPEWYVRIPCVEAYPKEKLFKWIKKNLKAK